MAADYLLCAYAVEDICYRHPNATEVNIYGVPALHSLVMKSVSALRYMALMLLICR